MTYFVDTKQPRSSISVKRSQFVKVISADELTHAGQFEPGLYKADQAFVGVRAQAIIHIPYGSDSAITHEVQTPGCWGVDYESGHGAYGVELFKEECSVLEHMLKALGVTITD